MIYFLERKDKQAVFIIFRFEREKFAVIRRDWACPVIDGWILKGTGKKGPRD